MATTKIMSLRIRGMHCGSCINHLERVLKPLGATDVDIDIANGFTRITFTDDEILADVFLEAISEAGYEPERLSVNEKPQV